jgi:hypothetical protein
VTQFTEKTLHYRHCNSVAIDSALNNIKLEALENNNLWLSSFDALNDPFEFRTLYLNKRKVLYLEFAEKIFDYVRNLMRVTCFLGNQPLAQMSMWAHYANNHKGFCVEYEVNNSYLLYPVRYEKERSRIHSIPNNIVYSLQKAIEQNRELSPEEFHNFLWLFFSGVVKSDNWLYENEYRILDIADNQKEPGELKPLQELGLRARHIFIGKSCCEEHRNELIRIAQKLDCQLSDVYLDEDSPEFLLKHRPVN